MSIVRTELRALVDQARYVKYDPTAPVTATNVQDAIDQVAALPPSVSYTPVTFAASPFTPTNSDSYLLVDTSGGAVTINLQPGANRLGLELTIKDATGNAVANPISVVPSGAETIDGLAPYSIDSAFSAVKFSPKTAGGYVVSP